MLTILLIFTVVCILLCLDYYIHNSAKGRALNRLPGPKVLPLIGNAKEFLCGPVPLFYRTRQMRAEYKQAYRIWFTKDPVINLVDPHDMEVILTSSKHITKSWLYDFLHPWLSDGLLTTTGEKWQQRRKILTPAFHFNILRHFCKVFDEQSKELVENIQAEVGKAETDVIPLMTKYALNSICETAMGTKIDTDNKSVKNYKKSIYKLGEYFIYRIGRPWLFPKWIFQLSQTGRKQEKQLFVLHKFTTDVIRNRRMLRESSGETQQLIVEEIIDDGSIKSNKKRLAMLDLLLSAESENVIDEDGIREEVDTFMFEGHDTTSMGFSFTLMILANNPHIQERIVAECDEIIGETDREITIDDLNKMRYLENCLKESLRLYPSVPFIARQCDVEVKLRDHTIPAGTAFNCHIFDMHRDANLYPAPDVFDPDRFTPENSAKRHPFAFIPFSAGSRNCIGQRFALLEGKSLISTILRNYKLEAVTTPDDIIFSADLVLRSKYPIKVKFVPR